MKSREEIIKFEMAYCQHYARGKGADMICTAGVDLETFPRIQTGDRRIKLGPCIDGHTLKDPTSHCPHWVRRTRAQGEKRADATLACIQRMEVVAPIINEWRKKKPIGKVEVIECPICKGRLHLSQSAYNGHVHGKCETDDCLSWME